MASQVFLYKARQAGKNTKGTIEAENFIQAKRDLYSKGLRKIQLTRGKAVKNKAASTDITWGPFGAIPSKEIVVFTKKIATMMRAGLPIVEAMGLVASQSANKNMKRVTAQIIDKLNNGSPLSVAFREHQRHFDSVYLNMVEAGEISGKLDVFLDRLVEMLEKQQAIKAGIKSALFYPVTLVVITLGISYFMLTNVVPTFQEMYEGLGAELPAPTQAIVDASNWIQDGGNLLGVILTAASIWAGNRLLNRFVRPYRKAKSIIALRLPIVGAIIEKSTVARMSLLMANLLAAGVSVIDTLAVSSTVSRNVKFLEATDRIQQKITTGAPLSVLFGNEKVFPAALSQLMAVGERTGNMDEMLTSIAKYYEEEFTTLVDGLSTIIEPLMIVFVGMMIGVMVVALYLPIFSAGDAIR